MNERPSARLVAFGLAVLVAVVTLLVCRRLLGTSVLGDRVVYLAFFIVLLGTVISGLIAALHWSRHRIAASDRRFRALVQNSSDTISLFDAEGTIVYQSPSIELMLGYQAQDWMGRNVFMDPVVHPDDFEAKRAFFDMILSRRGAPVTAEFRLRHADGSWRNIEAVGQNFLHEPVVAAVVANYRDITERKRAEEVLRASEQRFRTFADHAADAFFVHDERARVQDVNRRACEALGFTREELIGMTPSDFDPVLTPDRL